MGFFFVLLPHFYRVFLFRLFFSLFPTGMGPFTTAPPVVGGAQQPQSPPLLLPCFLLDFTGFSTEFHEVLSRVCPVAAETLRSVFDDAPSRSIRIRRCFFFVSFFLNRFHAIRTEFFFFFLPSFSRRRGSIDRHGAFPIDLSVTPCVPSILASGIYDAIHWSARRRITVPRGNSSIAPDLSPLFYWISLRRVV